MTNFSEVILQKAKELGLEDKVAAELKFLETTDSKDGKPLIKQVEKLYNDYKDKPKGRTNDVNLWSVYVLGLTNKKPEENKTIEKRRVYVRDGYPDIDTDFDAEFQHVMLGYITQKHNPEHVSRIGTYTVLKLKSYITRLLKATDPDKFFQAHRVTEKGQQKWKTNTQEYKTFMSDKVREVIKSLYGEHDDNSPKLVLKDENGKEHEIYTVADACKYSSDFRFYCNQYPDIIKYSGYLEGLVSQYGIHPAGIVISKIPLGEIAPLRHTKDENSEDIVYATQFTNDELEKMGLIKFDVLALSTLSVVRRCCEMVKDNYGIELDLENLPLNDAKTFELYRTGKLMGVFQCESYPMQETMRQIEPTCLDDVMACIALFRPGPMDLIPEYCSRKKGMSPISYFDKKIEPFVKKYVQKTYGILVYQEQVMQICNSLAGFSISEGYTVIKAVSKKKENDLKKWRARFIEGCVKNGVDESVSGEYWDKIIVPFASYGFNIAHSCCYAYGSYQTAYLKANFPEEFMVSFLNVETANSKYKKVAKFEKECEKMGMVVLPKQINHCGIEYEIAKKKDDSLGIAQSEIRPSIRCKGLSLEAAQEIVKNVPYKGIRDLAEKTNASLVDKNSIEALIEGGFLKRKTKEGDTVEVFAGIRKDLNKASSKGVPSYDMFGEEKMEEMPEVKAKKKKEKANG